MDQKLSNIRYEIYESQQQTRTIMDQRLAMLDQQLERLTAFLQGSAWIGETAAWESPSASVLNIDSEILPNP